ncbi:MAG TPA: ATP-binding protein [Lachnospiraceae bacterium]|nr:ATP-binding protein [Lachnospiraceae bacterium]
MSLPVLIIGRSGSGKTYSLKNFKPEEVGVISVEKGRLPFKSDIKVVRVPRSFDGQEQQQSYATLNAAKYAWIMRAIKSAKAKSIVIDDSQYLLSNELFDRAYEKGYEKYTQMAVNFRNLIHFINNLEDDEKIVYFLHHSELDGDGREKVKTIGKMLDEKLTVEGCFDIVLFCQDHKFFTQANGQSTAKSPEDMFELEIPNDLKMVDSTIREYYGMGAE